LKAEVVPSAGMVITSSSLVGVCFITQLPTTLHQNHFLLYFTY
jgi:hypothetical protein